MAWAGSAIFFDICAAVAVNVVRIADVFDHKNNHNNPNKDQGVDKALFHRSVFWLFDWGKIILITY